jgi:hypothetical protein
MSRVGLQHTNYGMDCLIEYFLDEYHIPVAEEAKQQQKNCLERRDNGLMYLSKPEWRINACTSNRFQSQLQQPVLSRINTPSNFRVKSNLITP